MISTSRSPAQISDALERGELNQAFELVTPRMIDAFSVAGTVETVAERFDALSEHVDGIVVGSPLGPDLELGIDLARAALEKAGLTDTAYGPTEDWRQDGPNTEPSENPNGDEHEECANQQENTRETGPHGHVTEESNHFPEVLDENSHWVCHTGE
ncbi:MAG: hypothetical protein U5K37_13265 [Natrialbaceae archaeon]|nr:hypothetical protein [Natrialbaceae archaeon]